MTDPRSTQFDIAIIGGGIAGSSLAAVMQRAGWRTAVFEREPVFRDRVRGEACHPWGVRELRNLGLDGVLREIGALELPVWTRYQDREIEMEFAWANAFPGSPPEIGFSHPELQEAMLRMAADAGAAVFRPAEAEITRQQETWAVRAAQSERTIDLTARFLVAADGKTSATRRLWGGTGVGDPVHHAFGGVLAESIDLPQSSSHQGIGEGGFSMLFPQGRDRWRVYLVGATGLHQRFSGPNRQQHYLDACGAYFPEGAFAASRPIGPLAFFPNAHVSATRIDGPHAVAIGDAAGAPDPSQGHGMSLVWRDVRVLRDLLLSEELQDVPPAFAAARRQYEQILRTHAAWVAPLTTDTSEVGAALRAQVDVARAADPDALGYSSIFAMGPSDQPTDAEARRTFFGEHLVDSPVSIPTPLAETTR